MNQLYRTIGISKQAVNQYAKRQEIFDAKMIELVQLADEVRREHPGCGVAKMYDTIKPDFIGRDRFIEEFMRLGYRIKYNKNYHRTTYSGAFKYPNLIKGMRLQAAGMVWQTDITYIYVDGKFYYAIFIIDVYPRQIVGFKVSDNMRATANLECLQKAIHEHGAPRYHHSDYGAQYTSNDYIQLLNKHKIGISMCDNALDNAYAERINRTIKEEYIYRWKPKNFAQLKKMTQSAVTNYNEKRPHDNLGKMTPKLFHEKIIALPKQKRPEVKIYTDEKTNFSEALSLAKIEQKSPSAPNYPNDEKLIKRI